MLKLVKKFWNDEQGLELSEYAVMAGIIIVIVVSTILLIGGHINDIFNKVEVALGEASNAT